MPTFAEQRRNVHQLHPVRTGSVKNSVDAGMKNPADQMTGKTSQGVNACR
jgi:hypothetical protein